MSDSRNDSKSHKRDRSVSTQRSLMSFFAKKIRSDEVQDRSKVNNEENVSVINDISAPVHDVVLKIYKPMLTIMYKKIFLLMH